MKTFVFKINPEHCPENAFDLREADMWETGEFTVPWPQTLDGRRLGLDEINRGDKCWIWLHVEPRKDKDRRSPGLVGQAVIDQVDSKDGQLLSVEFSEVNFRKAAVLRDEFKQHQESSNVVEYLLGHTTRRVVALTNDQSNDFESFINWLDHEKRRLQEQYKEVTSTPRHSDAYEKVRDDSSARENWKSEKHVQADDERIDQQEDVADEIHEGFIENRTDIGPTEKERLLKSRRGQGIFKKNVRNIESACRVTGVDCIEHLRASHIKPWRNSSDFEKLDGSNGLLLSPHIDHLFDQGFISFSDAGEMLVSPKLAREVLENWGICADVSCGAFRESQRPYLAYHRDQVFKN